VSPFRGQKKTRAARTRTGNQRIMSPAGEAKKAGKCGVSEREGAPQGAPNPETAKIIAALENLPPAIRAAILAMVKATSGRAGR